MMNLFTMKNILLIVLATPGIISAQKQVGIADPILHMTAYSLAIPANWSFEGMFMQGTSCVKIPFPIFRAISPDGITEVKALPRLDWTWTQGGAPSTGPDCVPYAQTMSAADFLNKMVAILHVNFVRSEPVPELAQSRQETEQQNQRSAANTPRGMVPLKQTVDMASFIVQYEVNNVLVEERLKVDERCAHSVFGFPPKLYQQYSCSAYVYRFRTRQGNLQASAGLFKSIETSLKVEPQWGQRHAALSVQQIADEGRRNLEAQRKEMADFAAVHTRMHEDMMAATQRGTDIAIDRAVGERGARSRMSSDWADYALDLQKNRDPNTGQESKHSSQHTYTWINESGQVYQTDYANDNPNGKGTGTWTLQQTVR